MARGDLQVQDLRVIMLLAQARVPLTTKQIGERLDIPMRTVQRIINAIDTATVLSLEYVSPKEQKPKRREIEPAGVWIAEGRTYVVGFDRQKRSMRTFALDRIRTARLAKERFTPRGDFDVGEYFKNAV